MLLASCAFEMAVLHLAMGQVTPRSYSSTTSTDFSQKAHETLAPSSGIE